MLALTIRQPYAWAVAIGAKPIENRTRLHTWQRAEGQRLALHAGRTWHPRGDRDPLIWQTLERRGWPAGPGHAQHAGFFATGAIIGTVDVVDVHEADGDCCPPWGDRPSSMSRDAVVHLVLERPREIDPIPCRGALGLWRVPKSIELELLEAVRR